MEIYRVCKTFDWSINVEHNKQLKKALHRAGYVTCGNEIYIEVKENGKTRREKE